MKYKVWRSDSVKGSPIHLFLYEDRIIDLRSLDLLTAENYESNFTEMILISSELRKL